MTLVVTGLRLMRAPPMASPPEVIDFVSEWTTISAPWAMGRIKAGVAQVASTMSGMPQEWARSARALMSVNDCWGLDGISM